MPDTAMRLARLSVYIKTARGHRHCRVLGLGKHVRFSFYHACGKHAAGETLRPDYHSLSDCFVNSAKVYVGLYRKPLVTVPPLVRVGAGDHGRLPFHQACGSDASDANLYRDLQLLSRRFVDSAKHALRTTAKCMLG